ncbi:MAG TPA: signal peptidase II [Gemmatimonadaceae bacterium]|nr:signal peptidase II [Gemmatimonadaceae bacterium]
MISPKARRFWPIILALVAADWATKQLAVDRLSPAYVQHEVIGDVVCFTLAYNPGAAMSLSLGDHSRLGFALLSLVALALLGRLYRQARPDDGAIAAALGLVCGGATGNLLDRLRSARGVVDFIDVGIGDYRFWTFNVADIGVTVGAALLTAILWRRESARRAAEEEGVSAAAGGAAR